MTGADWINRLRRYLADTPGDIQSGADYDPDTCEWSPAELVDYWNAGREELHRAQPIADTTSEHTTVQVLGGSDGRVVLGDPVLYVDRVLLDGVPLPRTGTNRLDYTYRSRANPWETRQAAAPEAWLLEPGQPPTLRLWPAPLTVTAVRLHLQRLPLAKLCLGTINLDLDEPVTEQQGQQIIWWAASLAYSRPHSRTFDADQAQLNAQRFEAAVGPRPDAHGITLRQQAHGRPPLRVRTHL
jgi:hypothetical protein